MKKAILSLFVAISLLIVPIAHALGMSCESDNCQMSDQTKKQDNDKMANAGHHCCCTQLSTLSNLAVAEQIAASSKVSFTFEQDVVTSVVGQPPLKPPSHA